MNSSEYSGPTTAPLHKISISSGLTPFSFLARYLRSSFIWAISTPSMSKDRMYGSLTALISYLELRLRIHARRIQLIQLKKKWDFGTRRININNKLAIG
ncbi:unnamed protein product [Phytophthora fragariaefolia]|uniref:Unnamed protein product n=1 Tax=Phytophthora fragariaefolia TaxID=1490495 RepID=A0A9W6Y1A3_9STRA|nr:unnamed protein product [Phytophthora fragariaefolia]